MKVTIRTKELKNGNRSIYLDVYDKGERKYEYLRLYLVPEVDDRAKRQNKNAMKKANEIKAEYILGMSDLLKPKVKTKEETTLQSWLDEYFRRIREERNVSDATIWQTAYVKEIIENYLSQANKKNIKIMDFGRKEIIGLLKYLSEYRGVRDKRYSPGTLKTFQQRIVAIFNGALQEGMITVNPIDQLSKNEVYGKVTTDKQPLTIEEVERIAAADVKYPIVRDAFVFACFTGLRISDIRTLKWREIKDIAGYPTIVKIQQKTKQLVQVPISEIAFRLMPTHRWDNYVFHLPSKSCVQKEIGNIAEAADIQKAVTFHTSRHTFATLSMTAGSTLKTISTLLGHSSVGTTAIYADVEMDNKASTINKLSELFQ